MFGSVSRLYSLGVRPFPHELIPKGLLGILFPSSTPKNDTPETNQASPEKLMAENIPEVLSSSLFQYQVEGILMALQREGRVMLADDMGLGKSIQALGIACCYRDCWPLLILAPASMVASWAEQVMRWLSSFLVEDDLVVAYDGRTSLDGCRVAIASYDLAVRLLPASPIEFQMIIADESHALKNADSKRTRTLLPFLQKAKKLVLLSGTPVLSRPMELYPQLQALLPPPSPLLPPTLLEFGRRYCGAHMGLFGWDFRGSSNLRELQVFLELTVMIRRTKDEVLLQLPAKIRHQIYLRLPSKDLQAFRAIKNQTPALEIPEELNGDFYRKAEYMALFKKSAECKLGAVISYIDDLLEDTTRKVLIFAHHQSMLDGVESHLEKHSIGSIRIDGKTAPSQRQSLCHAFQTRESIRVALLSITAASTGLTLTAASTVVFAELFWNPGVMLQAEDRAHRIGQKDCVSVHYLLARETLDENIWPLILRKLSLLEAVGLGKNDLAQMKPVEHDPEQLRIDQFFLPRTTICTKRLPDDSKSDID